jgi:hypothetical protein
MPSFLLDSFLVKYTCFVRQWVRQPGENCPARWLYLLSLFGSNISWLIHCKTSVKIRRKSIVSNSSGLLAYNFKHWYSLLSNQLPVDFLFTAKFPEKKIGFISFHWAEYLVKTISVLVCCSTRKPTVIFSTYLPENQI